MNTIYDALDPIVNGLVSNNLARCWGRTAAVRPADKWADRPSRLYAICHEFSGAREMPMTFEEAEEEQEREPWEDELISFVFTDSDIMAAALTNGT